MDNLGKGRFAAREQYDKSAQDDPEYLKVVREIQEGHSSRAGWLVGSGALDREDLAYIKDFKEMERQKEQDLRDREASEFARLKSSLEEQGESGALAAARAAQSKKEARQNAKPLPIKIVPLKSSSRAACGQEALEPPQKRRLTTSPQVQSQQSPKHQLEQQQQQQQSLDQPQQEQPQDQEGDPLSLLGNYESSPSGSLSGAEEIDGKPEASTALATTYNKAHG